MEIDELTEKVIGCAYEVQNELGAGFREKIYENALKIELEENQIEVRQQPWNRALGRRTHLRVAAPVPATSCAL